MNKFIRILHGSVLKVMIFLLFLNGLPAFAQKGFRFGVSAGIQNTLLQSKNRSEIDVRSAFCPLVTADAEYGFTNQFGVQSGIGYARYAQNTSKFRNNFNYLIIPLYFKLGAFRNDRKVTLSFLAGPNFKFLLSAENKYEGQKNDISDYTTGFHLDYTLGAGLNYNLGKRLILQSHLTSTFLGGSFNRVSTDGFLLKNFNYGVIFGMKYRLGKRNPLIHPQETH
ncbi:MAG: porin family protein [Bacteroidales bacterium]